MIKLQKKQAHRTILRSFFLILIVIYIAVLSVNSVFAYNENITNNVHMTNFTKPDPYNMTISCSYLQGGWQSMDNDSITTNWDRYLCGSAPANLTYYFGGKNVTINKMNLSQVSTVEPRKVIKSFKLYGKNLTTDWEEIYQASGIDNSSTEHEFEFYNENTYQMILLNVSAIWGDLSDTSSGGDGRLFITDINFIDRNLSYYLDYNEVTTEGNSETFGINVSHDGKNYNNFIGNLYYNNTKYTGDLIASNSNWSYFEKTIDVPKVNANTEIDFYWEVFLINSTDTLTYNTTAVQQTVNNINIDDCSSYSYVLYNFSLKDEENQNLINGALYNTSVEIDFNMYPKGVSQTIINFSGNFSENNNPQICLENDLSNSEYEADMIIRYDGDGYAGEFYHINNATIKNNSITTNINLFDLKDESSTEFVITYKDSDFLALADALITIQRNYVNQGVFKTVEIPKTDKNGQAIAHLDTDSVKYTMIVSKNGINLAIFDNVMAVCQDQVISECSINLNELLTDIESEVWEQKGGITHTISFDESTRTITAIFNSVSGSSVNVLLNTTKMDRFGNTTVCSDSLESSSGTLTCVIPESYGNITVVSELFADNDLITTKIYSINPNPSDTFGTDGIIMALLLMLTLPMMFISSSIGVIIAVIFGFIMAISLSLFSHNEILSSSSVVIWIIVAGGIIIYKISTKK